MSVLLSHWNPFKELARYGGNQIDISSLLLWIQCPNNILNSLPKKRNFMSLVIDP